MPENALPNYLNSIDHQISEPSSDADKLANPVDALLALRGLACYVVVIYHCSPPQKSLIIKQSDWSWLLFGNGTVAVWIFFCLSGYLMGKAFYGNRYAFTKTGVLNFFRNRVLRIVPLYYFVILLMIVLVYPYMLKSEHWKYMTHVLTFTYNPFGPHQLKPGLSCDLVLISRSAILYLSALFLSVGA
jgi:peptidoglycan/LPS O-acetylase OafA/YrhL